MTFLLDVNVLIALIDPAHAPAMTPLIAGSKIKASTPRRPRLLLTENGVVRIVGHPKYPNSPGSPAAGRGVIVARLLALPGHMFWPDDISLMGWSMSIPLRF